MSLKEKYSIFEDGSQYFSIDPHDIRLLHDRILVRDIPDPEKIGSIIVPTSSEAAGLRFGEVIAVGPGDKWIEKGLDENGNPKRASVAMCECGHHSAIHSEGTWGAGARPCLMVDGLGEDFDYCQCKDFNPRLPMDVKPGDIVIFDRRRECEVYIEGDRYALIHQEQSVLAVLDPDVATQSVDPIAYA
jgi:co-chaperonin GroES (HSP10)